MYMLFFLDLFLNLVDICNLLLSIDIYCISRQMFSSFFFFFGLMYNCSYAVDLLFTYIN